VNVDRHQLDVFQREVVSPVRLECERQGVAHLGDMVIRDAAIATEFGKFSVHNNFWRMEGDGDRGHNLELVLSPCPKRVYKPLKRKVARFSSPETAAREAVGRAARGLHTRPQEIDMVTNPGSPNVRFAAWGGLSDVLGLAFEKIGKVTDLLIDSKVADGTLSQEDAMNLKAGGSVMKELASGGVKVYEFVKDEKGDEVLVAKDYPSKAAAAGDAEADKPVFLGMTSNQLMLGGAGLLALLLYLRHQRSTNMKPSFGGF